MDEKLKHLEFLQNVITRMASNSFLLKGWTVLLVSALFALLAESSHIQFVYLAYFPSVAFWILDGYFLRQERFFKKLYDRVRTLPNSEIDFSMHTTSVASQAHSWFRTLFSETLIIFHGTVILTISVILLLAR
jgi:hypothetical protein